MPRKRNDTPARKALTREIQRLQMQIAKKDVEILDLRMQFQNTYYFRLKRYLLKTKVLYSTHLLLKKILKASIHLIRTIVRKVLCRETDTYRLWMRLNDPNKIDLSRQTRTQFSNTPTISIIIHTHNGNVGFLAALMNSINAQTYTQWEICFADTSDDNDNKRVSYIKKACMRDSRIKNRVPSKNNGIANSMNQAIQYASGEYIGFCRDDDVLAPDALFEIVQKINMDRAADLIYSDEDIIERNGFTWVRKEGHFKPDFSPDTLRSSNYIGSFTVVKRKFGDSMRWFRDGVNGAEEYDLILRLTEKAAVISHVPRVLCHRRSHYGASAGIDDIVDAHPFTSGKKALEEHLQRIGRKAVVHHGKMLGMYRVSYDIRKNDMVSIIILNRDHADDLCRCIASIFDKTRYKNYEIIIVENNSSNINTHTLYIELRKDRRIRIVTYNHPFNFSEANNYAVTRARGKYLLFLNNDTEVITPDWLSSMLEHAQYTEVGAVGAKLLYPDTTLQHGGVIVGLGGVAGHSHKGFPRNSPGRSGRLFAVQNLSAVTGACLLMRREVFHSVGGFDERFTIAFNDVDICLKIREKNYLIVWTPEAELYHHESKTRGIEDTASKVYRFSNEIDLFRKKWIQILKNGDPYYNINLTDEKEDFSEKLKKIGY